MVTSSRIKRWRREKSRTQSGTSCSNRPGAVRSRSRNSEALALIEHVTVATVGFVKTRMSGHRHKIDALINASAAVSLTILIALTLSARLAHSADMNGTFLVATRDMPDAMFQRTVILMIPSMQDALL